MTHEEPKTRAERQAARYRLKRREVKALERMAENAERMFYLLNHYLNLWVERTEIDKEEDR